MKTVLVRTGVTETGEEICSVVKVDDDSSLGKAVTKIRLAPTDYNSQSVGSGQAKTWKKAINANGYNKLNQWLGVSFLYPDTIMGNDGTRRPNPWIEEDSSGVGVKSVRVRRVGVGRTAAGDPMIVDLILVFNLDLYLATEAYNRFMKKGKDWGRILSGKPSEVREGSAYIPLPFMGACLEVDMNHYDVMSLMREHFEKQRFADRFATAFCERNILRRFLGTRYATDEGDVAVVHWVKPAISEDDMEYIREQLNEGRQLISLDGKVIESISEQEEISPEDADEGLEAEAFEV